MIKEEARKLMLDSFVEIEQDEYLNSTENIGETCICCTDGELYFKPKLKYPREYLSKADDVCGSESLILIKLVNKTVIAQIGADYFSVKELQDIIKELEK